MFSKLYQGELRKLIRPKALFILAAIIIVFLIVYGISYDFMIDTAQSEDTGQVEDNQDMMDLYGEKYQKKVYDEEMVQNLIVETNFMIENFESQDEDLLARMDYDKLYEMKAYIKALEYIQQNELYEKELEIFSQDALFGGESSAEGFMQGFISMLLSVLLVYGVVLGCISYSEEMDFGTLRMVFMRPITRNKLTSAKLLSLLTVIAAVFLMSTLLAYLYALLRYGNSSEHILIVVFNAMSVFKATKSLALFINISFALLRLFATVILGFALGTVLRKKTLAIIIGVIINIEIVATLLSFLKMGRFLFTTSSDLYLYFGVTSLIPAGGDFFLALGMLIAYLGAFLAATYISFNKRDIA